MPYDLAMPRETVTPREFLLAGVALPLSILLPIWLFTSTPAYETGLRSDQLHYAAMAMRDVAPPRLYERAPWCWRILTPLQVSFLPVGEDSSSEVITRFKVLAFASNWVSLVLLYALLRKLRASPAGRVFGVVAYAGIHWTLKFSFRAPAYVDFQMQTLVLAILLLMVARRYWATLPLFGLAALQKETALILIPAVAVHLWRTRRRVGGADGLWLACALVLPALALVAVRAAIPPMNDYSATRVLRWVLTQQLPDPDFWPRLLVALFSGLGILPLLLGWRWRAVWQCLRENPHWLAVLACGLLVLFGGVDKARLFLPMTPAVVVLAVIAWDPVLRERETPVMAWIVLTLLLNAYLGHHFEPMGPRGAALARLAPIHASTSMATSLVRIAVVAAVWCVATAVLQKRWLRAELR
jgi:hypothetical protein